MNKLYKIAIDGPSGVGKSTLAKALAKELGFIYVDTGALYRTVGLYAQYNNIEPSDEKELSKHFKNIDIELKWVDGTQRIWLNGQDVSEKIRTPKSSMYASAVSALPAVRAFLLDMQRGISKKSSVIMDGRDIGTVILPDADVKIFMSANEESRAKRRYDELIQKGQNVTFDEVLNDMKMRDFNDSTRSAAPLKAAEDAILFDNTNYSVEKTIDEAKKIIMEKIGNEF
ncbi:MAG: (d)CMP kinase [Clostridia bacterium]|nr:(d)CMP kinase [Clostridia bacterium]